MVKRIRWGAAYVALGLVGAAVGCGEDDDLSTPSFDGHSPGSGGEGGAEGAGAAGGMAGADATPGVGAPCESRAECAMGLACVDHVCARPADPFQPTGKECQPVQCLEDNDCCNAAPGSAALCNALEADCDGGAGVKSACNQYSVQCTCDSATKCEEYRCKITELCDTNEDCSAMGSLFEDGVCDTAAHVCVGCVTTTDCESSQVFGPGFVCNDAQRCVMPGCTSDADCFAVDTKCVEGVCVDTRECYDDGDCDLNEQCDDEAGKCVARQCTTNRFCADLTLNVNAECVDAKCVEPCETTSDCNGGSTWGPDAKLCVEGQCVKAGCESHAECDLMNAAELQFACLPPGGAPLL